MPRRSSHLCRYPEHGSEPYFCGHPANRRDVAFRRYPLWRIDMLFRIVPQPAMVSWAPPAIRCTAEAGTFNCPHGAWTMIVVVPMYGKAHTTGLTPHLLARGGDHNRHRATSLGHEITQPGRAVTTGDCLGLAFRRLACSAGVAARGRRVPRLPQPTLGPRPMFFLLRSNPGQAKAGARSYCWMACVRLCDTRCFSWGGVTESRARHNKRGPNSPPRLPLLSNARQLARTRPPKRPRG